MQTKIVPFVPSVTDVNPAQAAASQLQELVDNMANDGWTFISLTSMQTSVSASGCGSLGALAGQSQGPEMVSLQLLVFQKK